MAQETCCKRTSLAPRPPETWAGDLWDDSIVRISALGLASGCSGAAAGSLTAQTTGTALGSSLLPAGTNRGRGRRYCSPGHSCHLVTALDSVPGPVPGPSLCHDPVR